MAATFKKVPIKPLISNNKLTRPISIRNPSQNSQCPKLEIRSLRIKRVDHYNENYLIYLSGFVTNVGGADFPSRSRNNKVIFSASGVTSSSFPFGAIRKGQAVAFEGLLRGNMGGEFTPDIHVKLQIAPNKYKYPASSCRPALSGYKVYSQREIIIPRKEINRAIAKYHRSNPKAQKADLVLVGAGYVEHGKPLAVFEIKNQGGADAGASVLKMTCKRVGFTGKKGFGCPRAIEKLPYNVASRGYLINVPAIRAGQLYRLFVPLHKKVKWKKGRYHFTYLLDAKRAVLESNERNNRQSRTINK